MPLFSNFAFLLTNRTFKFNVLICASCQSKLSYINTTVTIITIISIIIGGLIGYYDVFGKKYISWWIFWPNNWLGCWRNY